MNSNLSIYPKISIITPSLNQGQYLEEAILSVINQNYPNLEYFIVDAGSTDQTLDIIKKYEKHLTWWVSEPDNGQSHAINKGLRKATGEIFTWLNADDYFAEGALFKVAQAFENPETQIITGYYESFSEKELYKNLRMKVYKGVEETIFFGMISTPAMFYRRSLCDVLGFYREDLHYFFDLEFYYRFLTQKGVQYIKLMGENLTFFRLHEASKTVSLKDEFRTEVYHLHRTLLSSVHPSVQIHPSLELTKRKMPIQLEWKTGHLDSKKLLAYFGERTLERMHRDFSLADFFSIYWWSFRQLPSPRRWRFYLLPFRKIGWLLKGI